MRYLPAFVVVAASWSQTLSLSSPSPPLFPGQSAPVTITYTSSPSKPIVAMQWNWVLAPGALYNLASLGSSSTATGKTVQCSPTTCILFGFNQTTIPDGPLATFTILYPITQPVGLTPISLANLIGTNTPGNTVPMNFTGPISLLIQPFNGLVLTTAQKSTLTLRPRDRRGNLAAIDGKPAWSAAPLGVVALTPSLDGKTAVIASLGAGTATVTVMADSRIGPEVNTLTGSMNVLVIAVAPAAATGTAGLTAGPVVAQ